MAHEAGLIELSRAELVEIDGAGIIGGAAGLFAGIGLGASTVKTVVAIGLVMGFTVSAPVAIGIFITVAAASTFIGYTATRW